MDSATELFSGSPLLGGCERPVAPAIGGVRPKPVVSQAHCPALSQQQRRAHFSLGSLCENRLLRFIGGDILALDQLISQLGYDAESAARVRAARELRGRMTMLLPVLSSLATFGRS